MKWIIILALGVAACTPRVDANDTYITSDDIIGITSNQIAFEVNDRIITRSVNQVRFITHDNDTIGIIFKQYQRR